MNPNEDYIEAFLKGDDDGIAWLYQQYRVPLYQFIYRFTNEEQLSIDIVQDTFLQLQKVKGQYDPAKASIKTYIFQIAYNRLLNKLKRRTKLKKILPFLVAESRDVDLVEQLNVRFALQKLKEDHRAVIILSYYHRLTNDEIADVLNIPAGTVKSRLHHAIQQLKKILEVDKHEK
ncbi:RNA polymerase ECF family sigma subunit [Bacillus oleivorans]|uniref:RNA polymerase ECF family sigma subunit n=1 Tax=Bacillus oleivorans TaxID=1448271 RepID=A0A285CHF2_9BACI|nr:RNA polymerase ECF family sigma subunit [Bacillus oleivorans]